MNFIKKILNNNMRQSNAKGITFYMLKWQKIGTYFGQMHWKSCWNIQGWNWFWTIFFFWNEIDSTFGQVLTLRIPFQIQSEWQGKANWTDSLANEFLNAERIF